MIKPFAKPCIIPIKPSTAKRPSVPKRMTIIAGFSNSQGTILCADSQETSGGYAKRKVEKLIYTGMFRRGSEPEFPEFGYAMGAAGSGHYADLLTFDLRYSIRECTTKYDPEKIIKFIEKKMVTFYETHSLPRGEHAALELLIVLVPMTGRGFPLTLHIAETAVNVVPHHESRCIGIGGYLAQFILERTLSPFGGKHHLISVAAYLLKQVRENVEGCGKDSHIYYFDANNGEMDIVSDSYIERLEKLSGSTDEAFRTAFEYATDLEKPEHSERSFFESVEEIRELREKYAQALEEHKAEIESWKNYGNDG